MRCGTTTRPCKPTDFGRPCRVPVRVSLPNMGRVCPVVTAIAGHRGVPPRTICSRLQPALQYQQGARQAVGLVAGHGRAVCNRA